MSYIVMSWNILAQEYVRREEYPQDEKTSPEWEDRLHIIHNIIVGIKPDILLLQEVTLDTFEEDFLPLFSYYDYVIHRKDKKRKNFIGNAILWRKDIIQLVKQESKTRSIHAKLNIDGKLLCISNVHFSAGVTRKEAERIKEVISCLGVWQGEDNVLVGGDYNDDFRNEEGITPLFDEFTGYKSKEYTCTSRGVPFNFDHILIRGKIASRRIAPLIDIIKTPVPNCIIPSDHIPIMSQITFN